MYISDLQFFHGLEDNPDHQEGASRAELDKEKEEDIKRGKINNKEKFENAADQSILDYQETIDIIKDARLKVADVSEAGILAARKEQALTMLRRILEDTEKYMTQISALRRALVSDHDDTRRYQTDVSESDAARRSLHNKLVQDIKIAMRFINVNFNSGYPDEMRLKEEARYPDRKGMSESEIAEAISKREYMKFPRENGIFIDWRNCPKDETGEREFIGKWALGIYDALTRLRNDLKPAA